MKAFKDLNISTPSRTRYIGKKVAIYNVFNKQIEITGYTIEPSNFQDKGDGQRLVLQIKMDGEDHIIFTGSMNLRDTIQKIKEEDFPFVTTIINDNKEYKFT